MDNGGLHDEFGGLTVNDRRKDNGLRKVRETIEAAEVIIRQKDEENNRLKVELQKRDQELELLKVDKSVAQRFYSVDSPGEQSLGQGLSREGRSNGNLNTLSGAQTTENASSSHISSPISFSPGRFPRDEEYEPQTNVPAQGLMPMTNSNSYSNLLKLIGEREKEIIQLREHLTDFSIKEAQIRNEKYVLEKRIAHMRMAFDQQQQDVVDAASKALSYRQDVIEENVRLTYALQEAQLERTTFVSSLLPLLAEYSLQPSVSDAQAIVSNIKVLFKHLQEKLIMTESKLKESQYQMTPWRYDGMSPNFVPQSPEQFSGAAFTPRRIGLELVPRPTYSPANLVNSEGQVATDWDSRGQHAVHFGASSPSIQNSVTDNKEKFSPFEKRNSNAHDARVQVASSRGDAHVKFKDPVSSSDVYAPDVEGARDRRERAGTWDSGISAESDMHEDPSTSYPYLQTVPEEPSTSVSEAADDDPLPAIKDLQISGEPYPGRQLQACGHSVNGTTSCNFEWVRHMEDGSVEYIEGAKQPSYLVTADDVETYLAIEVQPLDDGNRKGELVRVFANDHSKIVCDSAMQSHIEQNLRNGHASYKVSISANYLRFWEPAILTIKREGYSIKGSGDGDIAISEKFLLGTTVSITHGHELEFLILGTSGDEYFLQADDSIEDIFSVRDAIVLTLRLFITKAMQKGKGKGKKRRIFFKL